MEPHWDKILRETSRVGAIAKEPRATIAIVNWNYGKYVAEAIASDLETKGTINRAWARNMLLLPVRGHELKMSSTLSGALPCTIMKSYLADDKQRPSL